MCGWAGVSAALLAELPDVKVEFFQPFSIIKPNWNRVLIEDQQALMQSHIEVNHSVGSLHLQSKSSRRETGVSDPILKIGPISVNSHRSPGIL